jgi:hypothetical protein
MVIGGFLYANGARSPDSNFSKESSMRVRYRALALPAIVLGILLSGGCGPVNEENMADTKSAPINPNAPVFKTYGEKVQYDAEQKAKNKAATKGKNATPVAPPATTTPEEQPKAK